MVVPEFLEGCRTGIWTSASRRASEWRRASTWNYRASSLTSSTIINGPITTLVSTTTPALVLSEPLARQSRETSNWALASASRQSNWKAPHGALLQDKGRTLVRPFTFGQNRATTCATRSGLLVNADVPDSALPMRQPVAHRAGGASDVGY